MGRLKREFVKLETRLLNDHRWWSLPAIDQLVYIKLLMMAKVTGNKIPKELSVIEDYLRIKIDNFDIKKTIDLIKDHFPKLKENKHFMYFDDWEYRLNNNAPEKLLNQGVDKDLDLDLDKDIELSSKFSHLKNEVFKKELNDFLKMRLDKKKPVSSMALDRILKNLQRIDVSEATKMLEQSIINSWQGIFPIKNIITQEPYRKKLPDNPTQSQVRRDPKPRKDCTNCQGTGKFKLDNGKISQCWCVS